jgi:hypothetical protein
VVLLEEPEHGFEVRRLAERRVDIEPPRLRGAFGGDMDDLCSVAASRAAREAVDGAPGGVW